MFNPEGSLKWIEASGVESRTVIGVNEREPGVVFDMEEPFRRAFGQQMDAAQVILKEGQSMGYTEKEIQENARGCLRQFLAEMGSLDKDMQHDHVVYGNISTEAVTSITDAVREIVAKEAIDSGDIDRLYFLVPPSKEFVF